jgi:hypothetical protein
MRQALVFGEPAVDAGDHGALAHRELSHGNSGRHIFEQVMRMLRKARSLALAEARDAVCFSRSQIAQVPPESAKARSSRPAPGPRPEPLTAPLTRHRGGVEQGNFGLAEGANVEPNPRMTAEDPAS